MQLLHHFTLSKPYHKTLKRCDTLIKKSVSRRLHLSKAASTPTSTKVKVKVKAGGLVVMKLLDRIPVLRERRERRILNVEDSAAHW